MEDRINLEEVEKYLRSYSSDKDSEYKRLLCAYDYKKYNI
jgi:hypothetical protein